MTNLPKLRGDQKESLNIWAITTLILLFGLGFFLRAESMLSWPEKRSVYFTGNEPVLTEVDGYYYLNIARELEEENYSPFESKRAYPEGVQRAARPSLLPVLLHQISRLTGLSLNWVALWLPVVLSMTLLIPAYLLGKTFGGIHCAIGAVAVAALAPYFAVRTSLGRLDTDSLNLVLPLCCTYLFMRFGTEESAKRYLYLLAGILFYLLFLWWWDLSPEAVSLLALSPLLVALLFHYRPARKEALIFFSLALTSLLTIIWLADLFPRLINLFQAAIGKLSYISKEAPGLFPNIGESIEEQKAFSFLEAMEFNIANFGALVLALIGIAFLIIKTKTRMLYLLPMAIVGTFGFFFAMRFTFFLTPLLAIGFGYFFAAIYPKIHKKYLYYGCYGLAILSLVWYGLGFTRNLEPSFRGEIVTGMVRVQELTATDALIWSWWDEGHPLMYWTKRATVNDGMVHGGARDYFTALPLVSKDYRFSANFMQFYATRGMQGITGFIQATDQSFAEGVAHLQTILSSGPEIGKAYLDKLPIANEHSSLFKEIKYFYPQSPPPIFLFLDSRMPKAFRWIYWYGTWDTEKKSGIPTLPTLRLQNIFYDEKDLPTHEGLQLDIEEGLISIEGTLPEPSPVESISIPGRNPSKIQEYANFPDGETRYSFGNGLERAIAQQDKLTNTGIYSAHLLLDRNELLLQDIKIARSVLYSLLDYQTGDPEQYFTPIDIAEHYQIWRVKGDSADYNN